MMETANSIQSFPSTRANSTSFSAGKYSGIGMGSVKRKKAEREIKFNLILYFQFAENPSCVYCLGASPPVKVVVAKLYCSEVFPASFFADIFS